MDANPNQPVERELSEKEMEEQIQAFQASQQIYLLGGLKSLNLLLHLLFAQFPLNRLVGIRVHAPPLY